MDALIAFGVGGDLDDSLLPPGDAANRLIDEGLSEIDPEHLVFDMMFEYPPEVVEAIQQLLDRVSQYLRDQSLSVEPTESPIIEWDS